MKKYLNTMNIKTNSNPPLPVSKSKPGTSGGVNSGISSVNHRFDQSENQ